MEKVAKDPGYSLSVADIEEWEKTHGMILPGSVVFVCSDWSKAREELGIAAKTVFPGVGLAALKFLHLERHILFHGHEPLDADATPTLEGEAWLLQNGYSQAENVANLDLDAEENLLFLGGGIGLRLGFGLVAAGFVALDGRSLFAGLRGVLKALGNIFAVVQFFLNDFLIVSDVSWIGHK